MKTLKLDEAGDIAFEKGDFLMVDQEEEVRQSLFVILKTNKREWFLDPEMGLDYRSITGKPPDSQIRAAIMEAIGQEPRVELIESMDIRQDRQARKLSVFFHVRIKGGAMVEGEVDLNAQ